jgi:hypothetical protein
MNTSQKRGGSGNLHRWPGVFGPMSEIPCCTNPAIRSKNRFAEKGMTKQRIFPARCFPVG